MTNPVLVEVLRGHIVESRHRGAVVVRDADGAFVLRIGETDRPVFPRSAVKVIQALPLVESGAADAYGFGARELALACASHGGEPRHVDLAGSMLRAAGMDEAALECGSHWPGYFEATLALSAGGGTPSQLHNNCSGKHAGFVCTCRHLGIEHRGYVGADHASQRLVRDAMESVTGARHDPESAAIDGCSIPTYAIALDALALGFARMATGRGFEAGRRKAASRLFEACMAEPFFVAGTGRADTRMMAAAPGRVFTKVGAEGVFCAAIPALGLGIALKCDDGAERGAEAIVAALLARLLGPATEDGRTFATMASSVVPSRKGVPVGQIRVTPEIAV